MISSTNLDQVPPEQFRAMAERGMQLLFLVDATGKKNPESPQSPPDPHETPCTLPQTRQDTTRVDLGSDKSCAGSTMKLLTHHIMTGTPEQNLSALWTEIVNEYGLQGTIGQSGDECNRVGKMRDNCSTLAKLRQPRHDA